ncbi:MAG: amidohydrolase family protein, partial [Gammaproteobacteria bacterium]|nr:amidohydrolase family protein [Gammaproteobacteria bacterium]
MKPTLYQSLFIVTLSVFFTCSIQVQAQADSESTNTTNRLIVMGGTIVDVRTGDLQPNATIVMENDRIIEISSEAHLPEANDQIVDATGQYILPGLIDAHVHYEDFSPELFLNHGVTTVLDLGNDFEWIKATSEAIEDGWVPGPRLYYSTPHFDASPPEGSPLLTQRGHKHYVDTVAQAREAMTEYLAQGISAVKIYEKLTPEVLTAITRMADRANIPVIGHYLDAPTTIATGGTGIEHLYAIVR